MKTTNPATPILVGALAVASIVGATVFAFHQNSTSTSASKTPTTSQTSSADTTGTTSTTSVADNGASASSVSSSYKDGTYTATASYSVPHGYQNTIDVTVTVKDGVVTAVKTSHNYQDQESSMYIDAFDAAIQSSAVDKAIGTISSLSRVGGASLTTYGFDEAIATIANQAKT